MAVRKTRRLRKVASTWAETKQESASKVEAPKKEEVTDEEEAPQPVLREQQRPAAPLDSDSDSDDEAPEAVSLSVGKQHAQQAEKRAQSAVDELAAEKRKRRREVDARLKQQQQDKRGRQPQTTETVKGALPAALLEDVAAQDEERKRQKAAIARDEQQRGTHTRLDLSDVDSDDEVLAAGKAAGRMPTLPGGGPAQKDIDWVRGTKQSVQEREWKKRTKYDTGIIEKDGFNVAVLQEVTQSISRSVDQKAVGFRRRQLYSQRVTRGDGRCCGNRAVQIAICMLIITWRALILCAICNVPVAMRHSAFRRMSVPMQFRRKDA
ncbi:hypothetical protein THASP1DRAFT_24498 [Thamnocephalis sphaerospora]|uniref:Uncharacterized protein n=1 Tax=Thamnocephalis sphaerospora TaxID=78915 RepID=A0A4P9XN51_9FUNG|nr:hypothetical protein THASP1DRAFT_24498 [Thamnocephalis sphaerospora]|eukprot:RKP07346.1 hypothetical protein THASP1DRAFT_24498 [Thamnocephalis sphaerospora]